MMMMTDWIQTEAIGVNTYCFVTYFISYLFKNCHSVWHKSTKSQRMCLPQSKQSEIITQIIVNAFKSRHFPFLQLWTLRFKWNTSILFTPWALDRKLAHHINFNLQLLSCRVLPQSFFCAKIIQLVITSCSICIYISVCIMVCMQFFFSCLQKKSLY